MSLMEIIITLGLISALATLAIYLINPYEQIAKAKDSKRKNDLNELRKIFESWMTDKGCYPKKSEVCYNPGSSTNCNLCTTNPSSPSLKAYTSTEICDPESPIRDYLYEEQGDPSCPTAFVVYSKLTAKYNPSEDLYKCTALHSCGPPPVYGYDYLVTSPNAAIPVATLFTCYTTPLYGLRCSACGPYADCEVARADGICLSFYPSRTLCCQAHPGAGNCP